MKELIITVPNETVSSLEQYVEELGGQVKKVRQASAKENLRAEIKDAVNEMKLIKAGKKKARNADEFLNEL